MWDRARIVLAITAVVSAASGCRGAAGACEDFIDAVAKCEGAADSHYNQAWCDETVERGCDSREYYACLEDNLQCVDGEASTAPVFCDIAADVVCPDD